MLTHHHRLSLQIINMGTPSILFKYKMTTKEERYLRVYWGGGAATVGYQGHTIREEIPVKPPLQ